MLLQQLGNFNDNSFFHGSSCLLDDLTIRKSVPPNEIGNGTICVKTNIHFYALQLRFLDKNTRIGLGKEGSEIG